MADKPYDHNRRVSLFLGTIVRMPPPLRSVIGGAEPPGNMVEIKIDEPIYMELVNYISPAPIHGLLMYDSSTSQTFFFGYKCPKCKEVFLVPDTVDSIDSLATALRHCCTDSDGFVQVLH